MTPPKSEPIVLHRLRYRSPIGPIECLFDDATLVALDFEATSPRTLALLARNLGRLEIDDAPDRLKLADTLDRYFAGELRALDRLTVRRYGTKFQQKVWTALRRIPAGETTSYQALATKLLVPEAQRAVGAANGANPISLVVPCHRVIGSDGSLVNYGGGIDRKRWLLRHEGALT
jgi:methylated-DNA-[protein]-cysteine S-methyltransferase